MSNNEYERQILASVRQRQNFLTNPKGAELLNAELDTIQESFRKTRQIPSLIPEPGRFIRTEGATGTTTSTLSGLELRKG